MSGGVSATIDHPTSYSNKTCYIGAHIDRIVLVRKSTSAVIKEWTNDNSPRLGSVLWSKVQVGMNRRDLATAYSSITSYGYLEGEGVQVNFEKQVVASVEVRNWSARGKSLAKLLTEKYWPPIEIDCAYNSICEGQWKASEEVSVYMTIMSVIYQPRNVKPPTGYSSGR